MVAERCLVAQAREHRQVALVILKKGDKRWAGERLSLRKPTEVVGLVRLMDRAHHGVPGAAAQLGEPRVSTSL